MTADVEVDIFIVIICALALFMVIGGIVFIGPEEGRAEDISCPVCGYYCTGKGGRECIDKPGFVARERGGQ